jgi:arsenate reductase (thioredoxin)
MDKIKVLFVCVHNSARSQMAEAFLNQLAGEGFFAESAGFEPGNLNPLVVEAMKEIGIDISSNQTKSVFDFFKQGRLYHFVIAVCDGASAERCPIFPGVTKRLGWSFEDPASFTGNHDENLSKTRLVRDGIKAEVENFIKTHHQYNF